MRTNDIFTATYSLGSDPLRPEYSNRRKQLYEGVHINTNTIYSCYLKGGIIRRKRD